MVDYIPKVSRDDVLRILARDYSDENHESILSMLSQYVALPRSQNLHRVHLAVLKLADGSASNLQRYVDAAKIDFRDVLAPAESPLFCQLGFVRVSRLTPPEVAQLQESDWHQYQEWFNAKLHPTGTEG